MTSDRHTAQAGPNHPPSLRPEHGVSRSGANTADEVLLDAARDCLLAVGWRRTTLTDVARRAGVSRMTIYRRWPDMQTLMSDLMTREWAELGARSALVATPDAAPLQRISVGVVEAVSALRANALFRRIVELDPELLLTYLLHRRGRTQDTLLGVLVDQIGEGQSDGSVRAGDAAAMARAVLLAAQGFAVSSGTMADAVPEPQLAAELEAMLLRYLAP